MILPNDRNNGPLRVQERDITKTCIDYLKLRGWHCQRQNAGAYGKAGVADWICLHYGKQRMMWVEFKRPGARMTCRCAGKRRKCTLCAQKEFAQQVNSMGGLLLRVWDVGEFIAWYELRYGVEGQLRLQEAP